MLSYLELWVKLVWLQPMVEKSHSRHILIPLWDSCRAILQLLRFIQAHFCLICTIKDSRNESADLVTVDAHLAGWFIRFETWWRYLFVRGSYSLSMILQIYTTYARRISTCMAVNLDWNCCDSLACLLALWFSGLSGLFARREFALRLFPLHISTASIHKCSYYKARSDCALWYLLRIMLMHRT